jgi:hypothetical protein
VRFQILAFERQEVSQRSAWNFSEKASRNLASTKHVRQFLSSTFFAVKESGINYLLDPGSSPG